ncbi:MAG: hypothetical protein ACK5P7_11745 [Bdellovibrio sp.]|jgi:hypothetical protein
MNRLIKTRVAGVGLLFAALTLTTPSAQSADEPAKKPFRQEPLYTLAVKDAAYLKEMLQKNVWLAEFEKTTMFRGLIHKIGPVAHSLARPEDAWQGRLLDFVYDSVLKGRPLEIDYYSKRMLSPVVFRARDLSKTEKTVLESLIKVFRNGENKDFYVTGSKGANQVSITPLRFYTEKLAMQWGTDCITLGRDPELVAKSSTDCALVPVLKKEGLLLVDMRDLMPSFRGVIDKFYAAGSRLQIDLTWQKGESRFVAQEARVPVQNWGAFVTGTLPATWLKAIPATSHLLVTQFVPEPKAWTIEGISEVLAQPTEQWKGGATVPITLVYLGMEQNSETKNWKPLSALIVPVKSKNNEALSGLSSLFSETKHYEVGFRRVCQNLIVFSPDPEAIRKIEDSCKAKGASFAQLPPEFLKNISGKAQSTVLYANTSRFFGSLLEIGTKTRSWNETQVKQARNLLSGLPTYLFSGSESQKEIVFKGVSR